MWSDKGANPWVVEVLWWGYRIPFRRAPTLSREPIPYPGYSPDSIRGKALEGEVQALLDKGAIELAPLPSPGFYSRLFVVMKASGAWRPVIDLSLLNLRVQQDILQDGDSPVRTSVSTCWGLDGVSRLEGCVLAGSNASGISQVPQIRGGREGVPIQSSLLWSLHRSSGFHPGHGSCFGVPSPDRDSVASLSRRLVDSSLLSGAGSCSGDSTSALQGSGNRRQLGEVTADSNSADGLSRSSFGLNLFQGLVCPEGSREASLNWQRILEGHSIFRPSLAKIADFLFWLRRF